MRIRLIGGQIRASQLRHLVVAASDFGDGRVHVTSRANLQVRGFPGAAGRLDEDALAALEATGLLPSGTHELVRNVLISPQTGLAGGRADLRRTGQDLDRLLCSRDRLAELPGRFLFALDDGRGDLLSRSCDLGLIALDADAAQLRVGDEWGPIVELPDAPTRLIDLAERFLATRPRGPAAPWHVAELDERLVVPSTPDPRVPAPAPSLPYGDVPGGRHVPVPDAGLDADSIEALAAVTDHLVVTPWRGLLVPEDPA